MDEISEFTVLGWGPYANVMLKDLSQRYRLWVLSRVETESDLIWGNLRIIEGEFAGNYLHSLDLWQLSQLCENQDITIWDLEAYKARLEILEQRVKDKTGKSALKNKLEFAGKTLYLPELNTETLKLILATPNLMHKRQTIKDIIAKRIAKPEKPDIGEIHEFTPLGQAVELSPLQLQELQEQLSDGEEND